MTISGTVFTWDASDNRFEAEVSSSSAVTRLYNTFSSVNETGYEITVGDMRGAALSVTWFVSLGGGGNPGIYIPPQTQDSTPSPSPIIFTPPQLTPFQSQSYVIIVGLILALYYGVYYYDSSWTLSSSLKGLEKDIHKNTYFKELKKSKTIKRLGLKR